MTLDFIVIGAQKCATTTLYHHLRTDARIRLPADKEAPYFVGVEAASFSDYFEEKFGSYDPEKKYGTVSPQYMTSQGAAERISRVLPRIKLIAILRDPIDRAISHHKMMVKRGLETRALDVALTECLSVRDVLYKTGLNETTCYLSWGRYKTILGWYYQRFSSDQILLLDFSDFSERPREIFEKSMRFIGFDEYTQPSNIEKKYHVGGMKRKYPGKTELSRFGALRRIWRLLPETDRERISFWYDQWNTSEDKSANQKELRSGLVADLQSYFQDDYDFLKSRLS